MEVGESPQYVVWSHSKKPRRLHFNDVAGPSLITIRQEEKGKGSISFEDVLSVLLSSCWNRASVSKTIVYLWHSTAQHSGIEYEPISFSVRGCLKI